MQHTTSAGVPPRSRRRRLGATLAAAVLAPSCVALFATPRAAADPAPVATAASPSPMVGYDLLDLVGVIPGTTQVDPVGIDEAGVVAGTMVYQGRPLGFRVRGGQPLEMLEVPGAEAVYVQAIAPNGTIAGTVFAPNDPSIAGYGLWRVDAEGNVGGWERIAATDALDSPGVQGVTSAGDILVGNAVLHPDGSVTELQLLDPTLPNSNLTPREIGEDGTVVGTVTSDPDGVDGPLRSRNQPVRWSGGAPSEIGGTNGMNGYAVAANAVGDVVVQTEDLDGRHNYLVHADASRVEIGTTAEGMLVEAVNDNGTVVGSVFRNGGRAAFTWTAGELTVLNDLLVPDENWSVQRAVGVNSSGQIAGDAARSQVATAFRATPINPVVFVHGAGASRLSQINRSPETDEGRELWLSCGEERGLMSRWPEDIAAGTALADDAIAAFDALYDESCYGATDLVVDQLDVYGTLLQNLQALGSFHRYETESRLDRYTSAGCDLTQRDDGPTPNLFVFAYDWRLDNADSAQKLADFMGCVRQFWPDRNANILTHSMGSLVARRYVLDHPDAPVDRMITTGAPWLGAPKLVNVLQTGDFANRVVNGPRSVVQHISGSFPATHQLMAGALYHDAALNVAFREDGWDIDGNGVANEEYTFTHLQQFLDGQNPTFTPGTTAATFADHPGQVDWSGDDGAIDYTHIVGLQAGMNTIGTNVARTDLVCDYYLLCVVRPHIEVELVCGDGTVPLVSATRLVAGRDWNAPDGDVWVYEALDTDQNKWVEHTGMTANTNVYGLIDSLLRRRPQLDPPGTREGHGSAAQDVFSCVGPQKGSVAGLSDAAEAIADADHALRYVQLLGGTDLRVTDEAGRSTELPPIGGGHDLGSVTIFPSNVEDGVLATMPVSIEHTYTVEFTATGAPLQLEVLEGTQYHPSKAVRWIDVAVPAGAAALTLTPTGNVTLRVDTNGDGEADTVRTPTVSLVGAAAADVEAPTVLVTGTGTGEARQYAVSADDALSGVAAIRWSVDGSTFHDYDGPFMAPLGSTSIYAFAEDRAGNRSSLNEITLDAVPNTPLTTATVTPTPGPSGWNQGPVTVDLHAVADSPVASLTWSAVGAQQSEETIVNGDSASIEISAPGTTVLHFSATTSDGSVEPLRSLTVRLDLSDPSGRVESPDSNGVVPDLASIRGMAVDDASGVSTVEIQLLDADDRFWDGSAWSEASTWLETTGTEQWSRSTGNPAGEQLPAGGYRIRLRITDAAGRTSVSDPIPFTVSADAGYHVDAILAEDPSVPTFARDINDRGEIVGSADYPQGSRHMLFSSRGAVDVAAGEVQRDVHIFAIDNHATTAGTVEVAGAALPSTWSADGQRQLLALPPGTIGGEALGINDLGTVVGSAGGQPVRWADGNVVHLPLLGATGTGTAEDVNNSGLVVGSVSLPGSNPVVEAAVAWTDGQVRSLGSLGVPNRSPSTATAVNDLGEIVGSSTDRNGVRQAVRFVDGQVVPVNSLFQVGSVANDINDRGVVVGTYDSRTTLDQRAFVWFAGEDIAHDLNDLLPADSGWVLSTAVAVNELGQIIGLGVYDGQVRSYILSTVHAPVAEDVTADAVAGEAVELALDGWDPDLTDQVTFEIVGEPTLGSVELLDGGRVRFIAGAAGVSTFGYRVFDGRFRSTVATVEVTVTARVPVNEPPVASISAPVTVAEGSEITFDASSSVDSDGTIQQYEWDLDGDGEFDDATGPTAGVTAGDDGSITAEVRVTDDDAATDTAEATVTVTNVAPTVSGLDPQSTVQVGAVLTLNGTVADVASDVVSVSVDAGDGTGNQPVAVVDGRFTIAHTYTAPGTRTLVVSATDGDGGATTVSVTVTVVAAPNPDPGTGGPGLIVGAATFALADTKDQLAMTTVVLAGRSSSAGAFGLERGQTIALGSIRITSAGTWRVDGDRIGRVVGTGTVTTKKTSQKVTFEAVLVDGRTDRLSVTVRRLDGTVISLLTVKDLPVAKGTIAISVY